MTEVFQDHFWGEKNNGFFVLNLNMKHGQSCVKELSDCLRESFTIEESYSKLLNKLAKSIANNSSNGTFSPFWAVWKTFIEKLSSLHMQLAHTCSDLIKEVMRYNDEQPKKHKLIKETTQPTMDAVSNIQNTLSALHKTKELYNTRCIERERLRQENATVKDTEKAEQKLKKSHDEYKSLVEKYKIAKEIFERKMEESCRYGYVQQFQEVEEEHVCQMTDFVDTYIKAWENQHVLLGQTQKEFHSCCEDLTVQKLIGNVILNKSTGTERPGPFEFVELDLSSMQNPAVRVMSPTSTPVTSGDKPDYFCDKSKQEAVSPMALTLTLPGFLKNRNKKKEKKVKKKKDKDEDSVNSENQGDIADSPQVDEDGFCIRPEDAHMDNNCDKNSFFSSESDSESDVDENRRKLKVAIRPLTCAKFDSNINNVEDIRASVEALRLSPSATRKRSQAPSDASMRRSQSESDTLDKSHCDLLNLPFDSSHQLTALTSSSTDDNFSRHPPWSCGTEPNPSIATTSSSTIPSSLSAHAAFPDEKDVGWTSVIGRTANTIKPLTSPSDTGLFSGFPFDLATSKPHRQPTITSVSCEGLNSSSTWAHGDQTISSSSFNTTSMLYGPSRGPSPLTVGKADTIPLAVAFTDTINAVFNGPDEDRCIMKINGVVHMSFPIGIIKVFTDSPSQPQLSFCIKNVQRMSNMELNSMISKDELQSTGEDAVMVFDMAALQEHLRVQGVFSKTAYYNVEIIKYLVKVRPGVESSPLPVSVCWRHEDGFSEWKLDYRYNSLAMSCPATLKNVAVMVRLPTETDVSGLQTHPIDGKWDADRRQLTFKLNDISDVSEQAAEGSLQATFHLRSPAPLEPISTILQFGAEGGNLCGADFELVGSGYRISLIKKRFYSGKYYAEPESSVSYV